MIDNDVIVNHDKITGFDFHQMIGWLQFENRAD